MKKINIDDIDTFCIDYLNGKYGYFSCESLNNAIMKKYNNEINLFDLCFINDSENCPLLYYVVMQSEVCFFSDVLNKFENQFKSIKPEQWDFLFWESEFKCHFKVKDFYGEKYFDKIFTNNHKSIPHYSFDYFSKFYLDNKLDDFFQIENMKKMEQSHHDFYLIFWISFFKSNPEDFKEKIKKGTKIDFFNDINKNLYSEIAKSKNIYLKLPNKDEISLLIEKYGKEEASNLLVDFLIFQNELVMHKVKKYAESIKDIEYNINDVQLLFHSDSVLDLFSFDLNLNKAKKLIVKGLKKDVEVISYLIIKNKINKNDLLSFIENPLLEKDAQYTIIQEEVKEHNIKVKKHKI